MIQTVCMFKLAFPSYGFDALLREVPADRNEYIHYRNQLLAQLKLDLELSQRRAVLEHLGMCQRILGELDSAEASLLEALQLSQSEAPWKIAQNKMRLAHVYQWQNQFDKALDLFRQAAEVVLASADIIPLQASYHQHLGKIYFDQKQWDLALEQFHKALKIRKDLQLPEDLIHSSQYAIEITQNALALLLKK